jgi:hypothetical protein
MVDDDSKSLTIVLGEGLQALVLFCDAHFEEYIFLTFLFGHPRLSFTCSCQKLIQDKLTSVNRKFAYYIYNIYKSDQNFNTFHIVFHILSNPYS